MRMLRDSLSNLLRADLLRRIYLLLVAIHDRKYIRVHHRVGSRRKLRILQVWFHHC